MPLEVSFDDPSLVHRQVERSPHADVAEEGIGRVDEHHTIVKFQPGDGLIRRDLGQDVVALGTEEVEGVDLLAHESGPDRLLVRKEPDDHRFDLRPSQEVFIIAIEEGFPLVEFRKLIRACPRRLEFRIQYLIFFFTGRLCKDTAQIDQCKKCR